MSTLSCSPLHRVICKRFQSSPNALETLAACDRPCSVPRHSRAGQARRRRSPPRVPRREGAQWLSEDAVKMVIHARLDFVDLALERDAVAEGSREAQGA